MRSKGETLKCHFMAVFDNVVGAILFQLLILAWKAIFT
jgi:hypothetical protein